jgi:6-phosphogluconolactonase
MGLVVYVGTNTTTAHAPVKALGIYAYTVDQASGALAFARKIPKVSNPTHLAIHPGRRFLYAVIDVQRMNGKPGGGVSAFGIDQNTGALIYLNYQPSPGANPGYVSLDRTGRYVLVASRGSGSVAIFPIEDGGVLGPASDIVQAAETVRPAGQKVVSHARSIDVDPSNRYALVADSGLDRIRVYRLDLERGKLLINEPVGFLARRGTGPRRLAFHPSGRFVYVVDETTSSIGVYAFDDSSGSLTELQTVSTLPSGDDGQNIGADIHVAPSGRFVYASNRGHDSIAIFAIDPESGGLALVGWAPTMGRAPGSFGIDSSGSLLLVANQESSTIVSFRIDPFSGVLKATGQSLLVPTPVCLKFSSIETEH